MAKLAVYDLTGMNSDVVVMEDLPGRLELMGVYAPSSLWNLFDDDGAVIDFTPERYYLVNQANPGVLPTGTKARVTRIRAPFGVALEVQDLENFQE